MNRIHTLVLLTLAALAGAVLPSRAQTYITYALVDMQYILSNISEYSDASATLRRQAESRSAEVTKLEEEAGKLYSDYRSHLASLTAEQRLASEKQIVALEDKAKELRKTYFGPDGEMAKKREELLKPIEDKVYEAIKLYSRKYGVYMVFDRAAAMGTIVYADPAADISNEILKILGISVK